MHITRRSTSRLAALAASVLLIVGFAGRASSAAPAQALPTADLTCQNISFQLEFDRASLLKTQAVAGTVFCTSPNGSAPKLSADTSTATATANACPQTIITGSGTITWLTADFSKASSTFTFTVDLTTGTFTATITGGQLAGDTATAVPTSMLTTPATCPNGQVGFKRIAVPISTITFTH